MYGWMFSEIPGFYLLMLVVLFFIVMPQNISRHGQMSPDDRGGENPSPPIDKNKCGLLHTSKIQRRLWKRKNYLTQFPSF